MLCSALLSCLILAEGRNGIFSSWASCLHMLGAPQHGAAAETLLVETRWLIRPRDAPYGLQELPWQYCTVPAGSLDLMPAAAHHPTYLPLVGERTWGHRAFPPLLPTSGRGAAGTGTPLGPADDTRGSTPCQDTAPSPQGSRAGRSRVLSEHAGAGWQAGSFPQCDGSSGSRALEGAIWEL